MKDLNKLFDLARNQKPKVSFDELSDLINTTGSKKPGSNTRYLKGTIMTGLIFVSIIAYFSFPSHPKEEGLKLTRKNTMQLYEATSEQLQHSPFDWNETIEKDDSEKKREAGTSQNKEHSQRKGLLVKPKQKAEGGVQSNKVVQTSSKDEKLLFPSNEKKLTPDTSTIVYAVEAKDGMIGWVKFIKNLERAGFDMSIQHAEFDGSKQEIKYIKLKLKTPWGHKCKIVSPVRPSFFSSKKNTHCRYFERLEFGWKKDGDQVHGFYHRLNSGWKSHLSGKEQ